ncbi:18S rRNA pseudouridine methyltransferase, partial [Podila horticola]
STIRKALESGPRGPSGKLTGAASRILQKAQGFYKSCMNETNIAKIGHAPLYKELQDLVTTVFPIQHGSLISLFPDAAPPSAEILNVTERERLTSAIAHLYRSSALTILSFMVYPDERNPKIQQLWVLHDAPAIPDRVFLEGAPVLTKYRKAIEEIYTLVFGQSKGGAKFADDVIALETMMANFSSAAAGGDAATTSPHVSPIDLNKLYPSLDWPVLLQKMLQGTNITLDDNRALYSFTPSYLEGLDKLFRETPAATLQKYFAWMTIISRRSLLPADYREPIDRILRELEGVVNPDLTPDRWQTCVDSTSANLASIIGHFYVAQMFSAATKDQVQTVVGAIRDAYRSDFQELAWLDETTRANAITKLDAMIELIGYSNTDPNVG